MDWSKLLTRENAGNLAELGTSILGSRQAGKQENAALEQYQKGLAELMALVPPSLQDLSVVLQEYVLQGELSPEEFVAFLQEKSAAEGIKTPPQLLKAQYDVLGKLGEIANSGGLDAIDRARMNDIKTQLMTANRGNRLRTQQEFQERGMAGSGLELAARLQGDSDSIQAASKQGFDVAAEAQRRALEALTQQGQMAGQMRTQDFSEQKGIADSRDAISRFNAGQLQATSDRNVATNNAAQETNLANRQRVADMNTGVRNDNSTNRATAVQNDYLNRLGRTQAIVGQQNTVGGQRLNQAARTENQYAGIAKGIGDLIRPTPTTKTGTTGGMSDDEIEQEAKRRGIKVYS